MDFFLFVTFFPQLIAGPIVHHSEMIPQFRRSDIARFDALNFGIGLSVFAIGLFKKTILADSCGAIADPLFLGFSKGAIADPALGWIGALAYTLQLYFDFSAYSDMAIGLGRMFNIRLPINFDSPYKAASTIDFWQRWHITLSRFLRDYLYISLGGNRRGRTRRYTNLMITMLLGGLWHGAHWQFVMWGGVHGALLVINHGWRAARNWLGLPLGRARWLGRSITLLCVTSAWVLFRADNIGAALSMLRAMYGLNGQSVADAFMNYVDAQGREWQKLSDIALTIFHLRTPTIVLDISTVQIGGSWLFLLTLIVLFLPNVHQMFARYDLAGSPREEAKGLLARPLSWSPSWRWAWSIAILLTVSLTQFAGGVSPFIYYQF